MHSTHEPCMTRHPSQGDTRRGAARSSLLQMAPRTWSAKGKERTYQIKATLLYVCHMVLGTSFFQITNASDQGQVSLYVPHGAYDCNDRGSRLHNCTSRRLVYRAWRYMVVVCANVTPATATSVTGTALVPSTLRTVPSCET